MPAATKKAPRPKPPRESSEVVAAKHKAVADALMDGWSASDAARAGGYHPASAANVIRQEEVQQHLAAARAELTEISTIRRVDVLNIFIEAIDMARTLADPAQMINGADKVAKMMGYYEPERIKLEVEGNAQALANKFKQLTDAELLEIASGRARVVEGEVLND